MLRSISVQITLRIIVTFIGRVLGLKGKLLLGRTSVLIIGRISVRIGFILTCSWRVVKCMVEQRFCYLPTVAL